MGSVSSTAKFSFALLLVPGGVALTGGKKPGAGGAWNVATIDADGTIQATPNGDEGSFAFAQTEAQRRRRSRRRQTAIGFGGDVTETKRPYSETPTLMRPGLVKSEACNEQVCFDCADKDKCWRGYYGGLELYPQVREHTSYVAEVYARCQKDSAGGRWSVEVNYMKRGKLVIYADLETSGQMMEWRTFNSKAGLVMLPLADGRDTRIRAAFYPSSGDSKSQAKIAIKAAGVDAHVDDCMSTKHCLKILGDGSAAAFELRNMNERQLACLEGDKSQMSKELKEKCRLWDICMSNSKKKDPLKAFLRAGLRGKGQSLHQGAVVANHTAASQDPNTCVDPSADDAESWDCECLDDMVADCQGKGPLEDCLRARMCTFDAICPHWKAENCEGSMIQKEGGADSSGMLVRRQAGTKNNAINTIDSELDDTMQGKCSQ